MLEERGLSSDVVCRELHLHVPAAGPARSGRRWSTRHQQPQHSP